MTDIKNNKPTDRNWADFALRISSWGGLWHRKQELFWTVELVKKDLLTEK